MFLKIICHKIHCEVNLEKEVIHQWNNVAKEYAEKQRTAPNNLTNWQIILDVLGNISGKTILDACCGDGFFTNTLSTKCLKVVGFDGSKNLIKIAKHDFRTIDFKVADLREELPYKDNSFDIVCCSLALMDVDEISNFLCEVNRILKPDGKLVFSIIHPCFFKGEWEKDAEGNKLYKKIAEYNEHYTEILNHWGETTHYHRTLSWYSKSIKDAGFCIDEIKENPDNMDKLDYIKPQQRRIPLFICFSCIKNK